MDERELVITQLKDVKTVVDRRNATQNALNKVIEQTDRLKKAYDQVPSVNVPRPTADAHIKVATDRAMNIDSWIKIAAWILAIVAVLFCCIHMFKTLGTLEYGEVAQSSNSSVQVDQESPDPSSEEAIGVEGYVYAVILLILPIVVAICIWFVVDGGATVATWVIGIFTLIVDGGIVFLLIPSAGRASILLFYGSIGIAVGMIFLVNFILDKIYDNMKKTALQSKEYQAAKAFDERQQAEAERIRNVKMEQNRQQLAPQIQDLEQQQRELIGKLLEIELELKNNKVLPYKDIEILDIVLFKLENKRARTLEDALYQCDMEEKRRREQIYRENIQRMEQNYQAARALEEQEAQQRHNEAVHREVKRQADELAKIRSLLEQ